MADRPLRFGFDIDDVLFPSGEVVVKIYNERYGTELTHDDWYNVTSLALWGTDSATERSDRINSICGEDSFVDAIRPFKEAQRVLTAMSERGDFIAAITGRPSGANAPVDLTLATQRMLELYFPGVFTPEHIYLTSHFAEDPADRIPKLQIVGSLQLDGYFEDHLDHANQTGPAGTKTYLFGDNYGWNQEGAHESLIRVRDWNEIGEIVGVNDERTS